MVTALLVGLAAQIDQVRDTGSIEASLRIGSEAPARAFIEADLNAPVPVTEGGGHDGFHYYLAARDPLALDADGREIYVAYRHRRIFGPLLAGLGGSLPPRATVLGLSIVGILGFALAAAATVSLSSTLMTRRWAPLGVLTSVGLILSVQLVTGDALATGLGLAGAALAIRLRMGLAVVMIALSVLTKETSLLFAYGLSWWLWSIEERRSAVLMASIPTAMLAAWVVYLQARLGDALSTNGNLDAPLVGLVDAATSWSAGPDQALGWLAVAGVILAIAGAAISRHPLIARLTIPWIAMALFASVIVWGDGNNAVRVFAPC